MPGDGELQVFSSLLIPIGVSEGSNPTLSASRDLNSARPGSADRGSHEFRGSVSGGQFLADQHLPARLGPPEARGSISIATTAPSSLTMQAAAATARPLPASTGRKSYVILPAA